MPRKEEGRPKRQIRPPSYLNPPIVQTVRHRRWPRPSHRPEVRKLKYREAQAAKTIAQLRELASDDEEIEDVVTTNTTETTTTNNTNVQPTTNAEGTGTEDKTVIDLTNDSPTSQEEQKEETQAAEPADQTALSPKKEIKPKQSAKKTGKKSPKQKKRAK